MRYETRSVLASTDIFNGLYVSKEQRVYFVSDWFSFFDALEVGGYMSS